MRLTSHPCGPLRGIARPIGDKSLTHRGLILGSLARGRSVIRGANPGEDCRATAAALTALGAEIRETPDGWEIAGAPDALRSPAGTLDLGNSGTGIRLLTGAIAGRPIEAILTGDASLRRRPMRRIAEPLRAMGAKVELQAGDLPPIAVRGGPLRPIRHVMGMASAQVKGAILLAGLGVMEGDVVIQEPGPSRDHTERLLSWLGASVESAPGRIVLRAPVPAFRGFEWSIPSDTSAAAFAIVAATLVADSDIVLEGILLNPTRTGGLDVLRAMGARIDVEERRAEGPEPVGSIRVRGSALRGTTVGADLLVRAIDEVPVLAVAAVAARGTTTFLGGAELRVKESDRIESTAALARALGAEVETGPDRLVIKGKGRLEGCEVVSSGDHRIAMSSLIAGCAAQGPVHVDDAAAIATSDPRFVDTLSSLGARIE